MILAAIAEVMVDPQPTPAPTVIAAGVVAGEREPRPDRAQVSRIVEAASIVPARWRPFAACVEHRESHGNPRVINASGHMGLFQFSRAWMPGLSWVVYRTLVAAGMPRPEARVIQQTLAAKPIHHWPPVFQRIGFIGVVTEGGQAAAMRHWGLAGSACNGMAVS